MDTVPESPYRSVRKFTHGLIPLAQIKKQAKHEAVQNRYTWIDPQIVLDLVDTIERQDQQISRLKDICEHE